MALVALLSACAGNPVPRQATPPEAVSSGLGGTVAMPDSFSADVAALRELYALVGHLPESEVLIDDRPVPYARELWLPLLWFHLLR